MVTVNPVNDAPTAQDATITVVAGKSQNITLDYGDLETAQANLQVTFGTLNGTLDTSALPNLTYTAPSTAGDDSFTYTVTDRGDPDGCTAAPCAAPLSHHCHRPCHRSGGAFWQHRWRWCSMMPTPTAVWMPEKAV